MSINWNDIRVQIDWGERVRCEPWWRLGRRGPEAPEIIRKFTIWYVWAGRGRVELAQGTVPLHAGMCLWMRPGGSYRVEQDQQDRLGVTTVHFDLLDSRGRPLEHLDGLPPEVHYLTDPALVDSVLHRVVELVGGWSEARKTVTARERNAATLLLSGLLVDLDAQADHTQYSGADLAQRKRAQEFKQIALRIRENSGNVPPIRELAEQAGYSPDHFARLFESVIGLSPQAFVVQVRIDRARRLLTSTDMSMSQIADALGYQDVFYFSRQFKQKTGMPPSEYRRQVFQRQPAS